MTAIRQSKHFGQDEVADEFVGSNQAAATKISSLSITSANPATIRICDFIAKDT